MATYYTNEFSFDLPDELEDKTHHLFAMGDEGPSPFNVVVTRNPIEEQETLQSYADRLVRELHKALPQFRLAARQDLVVAGRAALELRYRWTNQGVTMHQTQVSFFFERAPRKRQVVQITATSTDQKPEVWDAEFHRILASLRLRESGIQAAW